MCVAAHASAPQYTCGGRDNLEKLVLSIYHVDYIHPVQVVSSMASTLLSHLTSYGWKII